MKSALRRLLALVCPVLLVPSMAFATSGADLVKAQKILVKIVELAAKYRTASVDLKAPAPLLDKSGHYFLPVNANGEMAEWAAKTLNVQLGALAGAKAGEAAGKQVASHVPFGGLASGLIKNKAKELGAVTAVGGYDFIKKTSELSFNNLEDYAVYLHVSQGGGASYTEAVAAAMAIYPDLEKSYDTSIRNAYERAAKNGTKTNG